MAKKKSRKVVAKGPAPKPQSIFDCPKCSYPKCVEVKLKRTMHQAFLKCRVCGAHFEMRINALQREVQVFCCWKDMLDEQEDLRRVGKHLGFQGEDAEQLGADKQAPGLNQKSKQIKKLEKKPGSKGDMASKKKHRDVNYSDPEDSEPDARDYGKSANKLKKQGSGHYDRDDEDESDEADSPIQLQGRRNNKTVAQKNYLLNSPTDNKEENGQGTLMAKLQQAKNIYNNKDNTVGSYLDQGRGGGGDLLSDVDKPSSNNGDKDKDVKPVVQASAIENEDDENEDGDNDSLF